MKPTLLALLALCLPLVGADKEKPLPKDLKSLKALAEKGDARAQSSLGVMYRDGKGVPQDFKEAVKWYRAAAYQGNASAQNSLGVMYYKGYGVKKSFKAAAKWYRKAAEQGYASAQYNLGLMYEKGEGVESDSVQSYKWFFLAEISGHDKAKEARRKMVQTLGMTLLQIVKARKQAKEFRPRVKAEEEK